MLNEASVVGKTIFSDGKGKLFFGYYKTDDAVEFVDYKTWKKLSFKDVSKGDTNKERVIKAILKNQKQFNKKVDFNMWAKKQKRSFEDTMDWFIQNGWINNINKGGIKESVDVLSVNEVSIPQLAKLDAEHLDRHVGGKSEKEVRAFIDRVYKFYPKDVRKYMADAFMDYQKGNRTLKYLTTVLRVMHQDIRESVNEDRNSNMFYVLYQKKGVFGKPAAAGYKDRKDAEKFAKSLGNNHNTMILDKQSMKNVKGVDVNEAASKEAMGIAGFTGTRGSAVEDFITKNELNGKKLFQYVKKGGLKQRMEFVSAIAGKPGNKIQKMIISKFKLGESVNEAKFGYKDSTSSYINKHKDEYKVAEKLNKGNEIKFYDSLSQMEEKIGHPKFMIFLSNALRGYKVDMYKDPKIKNPQDAQEALYLLSK